MEKRNKTLKLQKILYGVFSMLFMMVCGGTAGYVIGNIQSQYLSEKMEIAWFMGSIGIVLVIVRAAWVVQVYIHEMGHLICGLLTGYKFHSIRFGSLVLIKTETGMKLKKMKIAGTGGQCLMLPPAMVGDYFPTSLYNWGGCIGNLVVSMICLVVYVTMKNSSIPAQF